MHIRKLVLGLRITNPWIVSFVFYPEEKDERILWNNMAPFRRKRNMKELGIDLVPSSFDELRPHPKTA